MFQILNPTKLATILKFQAIPLHDAPLKLWIYAHFFSGVFQCPFQVAGKNQSSPPCLQVNNTDATIMAVIMSSSLTTNAAKRRGRRDSYIYNSNESDGHLQEPRTSVLCDISPNSPSCRHESAPLEWDVQFRKQWDLVPEPSPTSSDQETFIPSGTSSSIDRRSTSPSVTGILDAIDMPSQSNQDGYISKKPVVMRPANPTEAVGLGELSAEPSSYSSFLGSRPSPTSSGGLNPPSWYGSTFPISSLLPSWVGDVPSPSSSSPNNLSKTPNDESPFQERHPSPAPLYWDLELPSLTSRGSHYPSKTIPGSNFLGSLQPSSFIGEASTRSGQPTESETIPRDGLPVYAYALIALSTLTIIGLLVIWWVRRQSDEALGGILDATRPRKFQLYPVESTSTFSFDSKPLSTLHLPSGSVDIGDKGFDIFEGSDISAST